MNHRDREQEIRLQALAEQAERQRAPASGDPLLDSYRLIIRALQQPPAAQLPVDFAARVEARLPAAEEKASFEDWLMTSLLLGMGVTGMFYIQPVIAVLASQFHFRIPSLPWPLLAAAAASVVVAWALDRGAIGWRNSRRGA